MNFLKFVVGGVVGGLALTATNSVVGTSPGKMVVKSTTVPAQIGSYAIDTIAITGPVAFVVYKVLGGR